MITITEIVIFGLILLCVVCLSWLVIAKREDEFICKSYEDMMIGRQMPLRICWFDHNGTCMRVDSVPLDTDVEQYVKDIKRMEKHNWEYVILDNI